MEVKNYFATDSQGNVLGSAQVYLYLAGTTTLATGLQNISGAALANPFTSQSNGLVQFKAPDADYDLRVIKPGREFTIRIQCFDGVAFVGSKFSVYPKPGVSPVSDESGKIQPEWIPENIEVSSEYSSFSQISEHPDGSVSMKLSQKICVEDAPFLGDIQKAIDYAESLASSAQSSDRAPVAVVVELGIGKIYESKAVIKKGVILDGRHSSIKLPDGSNGNVVETEGYMDLTGTNSGLGVWNWGVINLVIDGNRDNAGVQPPNSGHGLAGYGRNFLVSNVTAVNTSRRGVTLEYSTGATGFSPFNGKAKGILADTCGEDGIYLDVSDIHIEDINVRSASQNQSNAFDGIVAKKGFRGTNINVWRGGSSSNSHRYSANLSDGCTLSGAHLETAATANLIISGNRVSVKNTLSYNLLGECHLIVSGSGHNVEISAHNGGVLGENLNAVAARVGASSPCAYSKIDVRAIAVRGGVFDFVNDAGGNTFTAGVWLNSDADPIILGTPHITDVIEITGTGNGSTNKSYSKLPARNGSINGVGNTQSTAAPLVSTVNRAFANSLSVNAFLLPKSSGGNEIYVANVSGVEIRVFASASDTILGISAGSPDSIPVGGCARYVSHSATQWGKY